MMKAYCEVIVEGPFDLIKGFVIGFLEGSGIQGIAIFEEEHHVENEGRFGQLMRLIHVRGNRVHLIVGAGFHNLLSDALNNRQDNLNIRIVSVKEITNARFDFSYKAFARLFGEKLKDLFGHLPPGLTMSADYAPREKILPEGKGVEAYAPLHEYEIQATGSVTGPVKEVIDFYGQVEHEQLVELGSIKLEYKD